jgi:hypothetical protein
MGGDTAPAVKEEVVDEVVEETVLNEEPTEAETVEKTEA